MAHAAEPYDRETGDGIVNVLKIFAALDVNERRKPQEGILGAKLENRDIELRIETSGSKMGEKASLRILDQSGKVTRLDELGLRPKVVAELKELVNLDHGLIICCGPASSGKTTTFYALMREIDRFQKNVVTIEDPIEVKIENVSQNEVNTKAGDTYGTTLRSLIRTEPEIMAIGELREQEAAEIACQVATSRLMIFSTVVAPDTISALFRLLDLGVEPALVAGSLTAILGQRLVRVLCETCKEPYKPKPEFLKKANLPADKVDVFYRPPTPNPEEPREPCPDCGDTAYLGRTGIFELLVITDALRELIRENPTPNAIKAEARKNGMIYLHEDGLRQVFQARPPSTNSVASSPPESSPTPRPRNPRVPPMSAMIDGVILLLVMGIAYAIFSEGLWGATLIFFNVLFAGLLAFNCYEAPPACSPSSSPTSPGSPTCSS